MLELNDVALEAVSGGRGSSRTDITVNKNYLNISTDRDIVTKGGMILFDINQFNGQQNN